MNSGCLCLLNSSMCNKGEINKFAFFFAQKQSPSADASKTEIMKPSETKVCETHACS